MLTDLGKALRAARVRRQRSLQNVAAPAAISATYLQKLERGVVDNPSPRVLARLADVLHLPYLDLLALAGYLDEPQLVEARKRSCSPEPHPLADQRLSPAEWRAVGEFIAQLMARRESSARGLSAG